MGFSDDSSSSSSGSGYSSDDEYLAGGTGGGDASGGGAGGSATEAEREAMIRKKLLESFYGTGAGGGDGSAGDEDDDGDDDVDGGGETTSASEAQRATSGGAPPVPPPRQQQKQQHGGLYSRPSPRRTHRRVAAPHRPSSDTGEDADDEDTADEQGGANILREHAVHSTLSPRHPTSSARGGRGADGSGAGSSPATARHAPPPGSTNLDSPNFDAASYTRSLLLHSSTETLLAENEKLATDVRGLDSTMQTLVYENYSKFIDATDAIRSIGRSVDASENGLRRLAASMERIERGTAGVDDALQKSREAVAEKLRVKRHLSRLDALLKLPATLRGHVEAGRYRLAAKSHAGAAHILARHSGGFESLGRIEMECDDIMAEMGVDLNRKLRAWSDPIGGGIGSLVVGVDVVPPPRKVAEIFECAGTLLLLSERDGASPSTSRPNSPSTGGRGALDPETKEERGSNDEDESADDEEKDAGDGGDGPTEGTPTSEEISPDEFKSLALVACRRLLERTLESPGGEGEDEETSGPLGRGISLSTRGTSGASTATTATSTPNLIFPQALSMFPTAGGEDDDDDASAARRKRREVAVVPKAFLDGLLDAATLFGVTFGGVSSSGENGRLLGEFVSDLFASFLTHARRRLLEKSVEAERRQNELRERREREHEVAGGGHDDDAAPKGGGELAASAEELKLLEDRLPTFEKALEDDANRGEKPTSFDEVSSDLVHLGRSVRELASGLALPEVGIDVTVASSLVDRTLSLTESIVRRQVAAHFHHLRSVTVKKCLTPFVLSATEMTTAAVVTSLANVLVEDALKEVDGALVDVAEMMADAPVDPATVRGAAERCAVRHAAWFAGSLERVAGCEDTAVGETTVLDVRDEDDGDASAAEGGDGNDGVGGESSPSSLAAMSMNGQTVRGVGGGGGELLDEVMSELDYGGDGGDGDADDNDDDDPLRPLLDDLENRTGLFADAAAPDDGDGRDDAGGVGCGHSHPHLTLSVAEACRLAGGRAGDAIEDSVAAVLGPRGGNNGGSPGRGQPTMTSVAESSPTAQVADRFELAAGRVLSLYATNRGGEAVRHAWEGFFESSPAPWSHVDPGEEEYYIPRTSTCRILEIARVISVDWADAFGGDKAAGPVPTFGEDEMLDGLAPPMLSYHRSGGGGGTGHHHHLASDGISRGLQLDVERMFAEKTPVYRTVGYDRDSVVSAALGMALKAMTEYVRLCPFSARGYRQLQVDAELLRRGVSHYVGGDCTGALYSLLDDALRGASERCAEMQERGDGDVLLEEDVVLSYIRAFLEDNPGVRSEIFVSDEAAVDEDV